MSLKKQDIKSSKFMPILFIFLFYFQECFLKKDNVKNNSKIKLSLLLKICLLRILNYVYFKYNLWPVLDRNQRKFVLSWKNIHVWILKLCTNILLWRFSILSYNIDLKCIYIQHTYTSIYVYYVYIQNINNIYCLFLL